LNVIYKASGECVLANPISQIIAAIASLTVLIICWVIFGPIVNDTMNSMVIDAFTNYAGTPLEQNVNSLDTARTLLLVFFNIFAYFIIFAVMVRLFVYLGFYTEEVNST
jgi:hypothetical protein